MMLFFLVSIRETNMIDFSLNGHKKDKTTVLFHFFFTICFLVTTFIPSFIITLTLSLYFMGSFF